MGNSGSGQGEEKKPPPNVSRISLKSHHKLLLDLNVTPKLRATENGAILQEGGTISFRKRVSFYYLYMYNIFVKKLIII